MTRLRLACALVLALPSVGLADDATPPPAAPTPPPVATPAQPTPPPATPATTPPTSPTAAPEGLPPIPPHDPADRPIAKPSTRSRELVIEVPGERSLNNRLVVGGLLAAGLIGSTLGVYWHLDSRDAADAVSADEFTGRTWTPEQVALVDRADRSKTRAIVAYSIGGAFLIGAIATFIATEPKSETAIIHTGVVVTPTEHGGTVVGKLWTF